ncbi:fibroblast growth factor-binding protein 1 [Gadus morhua]|uniref:fibroblast growth factor-binding protein 1 n=1 Tax=Gadus morhua TaxID=8049 RepID=UPI0011B82FAD|nr:fibroblast growth factor-binding protein 1 [Gadus morhua]
MVILKTSFSCLLLACLAQQVCVSDAAREKGRRELLAGDRETEPVRVRGSGRADRGMRSTEPKGKFSTKNSLQCTWASKKERDVVKLRISCENSEEAPARDGVSSMKVCEYVGKPARCPAYISNPAGFWKQVSRTLKKMEGQLCKDTRAMVRASMCKRAPREVHFKLGPGGPRADHETTTMRASRSSTTSTPSTTTTTPRPSTTTTTTHKDDRETVKSTTVSGQECTPVNKANRGEEYCSGPWSSVCSFFFSMLDSAEC